jgi:3-deoxy-D-manno-octulosonic-acid transferase
LKIYRFLVALFFYGTLPVLLLAVFITGRNRSGLGERFGTYAPVQREKHAGPTIWVHAASVGEVKAAGLIIAELKNTLKDARIVVTTMTTHGRTMARKRLGDVAACYLAPLDVPGIVERAIQKINPDMYICIETELWPVLLNSLAQSGTRLYLLNGRISSGAYHKYRRIGRLLRHTLRQFEKIVVISARDRVRYVELGAREHSVTVEGNVKYDLVLPESKEKMLQFYRSLLHIGKTEVFVAGSTHDDEEKRLLELYDRLAKDGNILFIIAPRHVERIAEIEKMLKREKKAYQLYSNIERGVESRRESLLLVDTMGELAGLYGVADYIFCGGSLVNKGGHNLMEAALWNKIVFYGPSIDDFHDAAELLREGAAGYQVESMEEVEEHISFFRRNPEDYRKGCQRAGRIAAAQKGCSKRQVAIIIEAESC